MLDLAFSVRPRFMRGLIVFLEQMVGFIELVLHLVVVIWVYRACVASYYSVGMLLSCCTIQSDEGVGVGTEFQINKVMSLSA